MKKHLLFLLILSALMSLFFAVGCAPSSKTDPSHDEESFSLTILSSDVGAGYISGTSSQLLREGEQSSTVKAVPNLGYRFIKWSNNCFDEELSVNITEDTVIFALFSKDYLELPVMEINTAGQNHIVSKENYLQCSVSVSNTEYEYTFNNLAAKIKGRGNSTWNMPKKPYKLKFEKKIDLFGNGAAKTWTLIANYCDKSLARNFIAYNFGTLIESDYCTTTQFVDLYLNGTYCGVYLICEQNEVGATRVNIDESYTDVNTGYLIEMDARAVEEGVEGLDWFYFNEQPYSIKSPDSEDERFSAEFVSYIKNYLTDAYNAILSKDITAICEYVDLDSFAKSYLVFEIMKCIDVGESSFYMFKDKNGKLKVGPLWDFDISAGNYNYKIENPSQSYSTLWAKEINCWYNKLLEVEEFKALVTEYLIDNYDAIADSFTNSVAQLYKYENSFNRNFEKWHILDKYVWPNPDEIVELTTWEEQVEYLLDWLQKSLDYVYDYYTGA